MHRIYAQAKDFYEKIVKEILDQNTNEIAQRKKTSCYPRVNAEITVERVIIPYISPDPKTNFLTNTFFNLYTKDDPILRFMPSIKRKDNFPQSINWYEGTEIGAKGLSKKDMIDKIFLYLVCKIESNEINLISAGKKIKKTSEITCENLLEEAYVFIGKKREVHKINDFKNYFCNTCLLFNCGIHKINPGCVLKYNEINGCVCYASNTKISTKKKLNAILEEFLENPENVTDQNLINKKPENKNEKRPACPLSFKEKSILLKHLFCLSLKCCILKKLTNLITGENFNCNELPVKNLPIKNVSPQNKQIALMEFFEPCKHSGPCKKSICRCAQNDIPCELSCFCVNCKNVKFCKCTKECNDDCVCVINNRLCDKDLCGCHNNSEETKCTNRSGLKYKKAKIFQSKYHGFGLFSNEDFIKANEFVMEYTGEIISDKEAERRGNFYEMNNCSYLFNLVNKGAECLYSIDSYVLGNKSRYINHSKEDANLKAELKVEKGITKIIFLAKRDIYKGEEFLFDYQFTEEQQRKHGMVSSESDQQ
ncbi:hypothetical protein NUSPORA_00575 [Nucleospora cyclopteri]